MKEIPMIAGAKESRSKAFQTAETGNSSIYVLAGVILALLLIIGIVILFKKSNGKNEQGSAMILAIVVLFIVFIIGASLVFLSENETRKTVKSNKQNAAIYIADGGVEKALWEMNRGSSYTGEANSVLGNGTYTVTISTPAGKPNQREIISTGQIGSYRRKIKVLCERITTVINVDSAVQCGGNVSMKGNCNVSGGTLTGVLVPVGKSVSVQGSASVTGTPATGNAPFPSFEDIFGMTMPQMNAFATTHYTNPGNNPACTGITWIDGDLKTTNSTFNGSGILIVNGDYESTGGVFNGVIFVTGSFKMTGNGVIHGSILCQSDTEVSFAAGTPDVYFDSSSIDNASSLFPFHILTWQEVKN